MTSGRIENFEDVMLGQEYNDPNIGYPAHMDVGSFIDLIMLHELSKNVDAYRLSTYIYKDIDSFDGRLTAGPVWDINHGYGNCDYGETWLTDGWLLEYNPEGGDQMTFWWELMWQDEYFQTLINAWSFIKLIKGSISTLTEHTTISEKVHCNTAITFW